MWMWEQFFNMRLYEILTEGVAGPKNCWPDYRKTGTQPGTGKNKGKRVNDCEKIKKEDSVEEGGILSFMSQEKPKVKKTASLSSMRKEFEKEKPTDQPSYMRNKDLPKNPKHVKTVREELEQEFDMIEEMIEYIADQHAIDAELVWEDLSTLTDDELYVFAVTQPVSEDWQKANKKDKTDGMSKKAVNAYRREHPGSKLKTAVTTKPSKLKKGSKASKRRSSYCSRSAGQQKMHNISCSKTPDKAICKARRRWNC